jgi:hypothetical protein
MMLPPPELDILARIVRPEAADLSASAARALLKLHFDADDRDRMRALLAKNQDDALSELERQQMRGYEVIDHLLDQIHAKARRSLRKTTARN